MTRIALIDCPAWPLFLRREEAARYVGVSVDVFDEEVAAGVWPPGRRRGRKGGLLTWDRRVLEAMATGFPEAALIGNLSAAEPMQGSADPDAAAREAWRARRNATATQQRLKHRQQTPT